MRIELQPPARRHALQRTAGADAAADAAVDAAAGINPDLPRGTIETQPLSLKPLLRCGEIIDVAGELHHHGAALIGSDLGAENLGGNVKVHRQPIGDRLMHRFAGEMQGDAALQAPAPAWHQRNEHAGAGRLWSHCPSPSVSPSAPPPNSSPAALLGRGQRLLLAALAAVLALVLFGLRGGLQPAAPLEQLARQSLDLPVALSDGRPTLVEFYADWCEACQAMAPAMATIERQHQGELDVVLLNVDNPRWQPEVDRYEVNGIPQLELFDAAGNAVGRALGARSRPELEALSTALIAQAPLPQLVGVASQSSLTAAPALNAAAMAGPRSHG